MLESSPVSACIRTSMRIKKGSAVVLVVKTSAGLAQEMNLSNPLHTGDKKQASEGSIISLKPRANVTKSPKEGCQWQHKNDF